MEYKNYKQYTILFNEKYNCYFIYLTGNMIFGKFFDFEFKTILDAELFIDKQGVSK